ncbi:hypothetical protein [Mesorhizobium sp. AR07]|uniref:hypothetical protein n=1 Tax=Mesorhizobium sp. AR07 TaxID=2865838 RepID=UPI00215F073A|nr:hypothetical protein [Mesorhizobium sp. AR07]
MGEFGIPDQRAVGKDPKRFRPVLQKQLFDEFIELRIGMLTGSGLWPGIGLNTLNAIGLRPASFRSIAAPRKNDGR